MDMPILQGQGMQASTMSGICICCLDLPWLNMCRSFAFCFHIFFWGNGGSGADLTITAFSQPQTRDPFKHMRPYPVPEHSATLYDVVSFEGFHDVDPHPDWDWGAPKHRWRLYSQMLFQAQRSDMLIFPEKMIGKRKKSLKQNITHQ